MGLPKGKVKGITCDREEYDGKQRRHLDRDGLGHPVDGHHKDAVAA